MTILQSLREPITVQSLVTMLAGLAMGLGASIAFVAMAGPAIRDIAQAPATAPTAPCTP